MKYEYLTRMINLIATTESEGRRVRLNFYHQYEGAYTVLFLTDTITEDEFHFYSELGRTIVAELFE